MGKIITGLVLGLLIGIGCRYFDIPLPSPPKLLGAMVVLSMTFGYVGADYLLVRHAKQTASSGKAANLTRPAMTAQYCGGPTGLPPSHSKTALLLKKPVRKEPTRMFPTKNDLPKSTRIAIIETLNLRLADAIALQTQVKQAHWNVKGPNFIALHRLFDEISNATLEYIDLLAERVVQLGGVAEGTARMAVQRSLLHPYPLDISTGKAHCEALASALATFGKAVRQSMDAADAAGDKDTSDICTEVSRGTDQWLWFVESHLQADA